MATNEQIQPVTNTSSPMVPVENTVAPVSAPAVQDTQPIQTPAPIIASNVVPVPNASQVYGALNVHEVSQKSPKSFASLKIDKMEKEIAKANSVSAMNQINIMNQRGENMGFLTGASAHQSRLDTAKLNAMTGAYNAKLADLQRKEEERKNFIATYGADPNSRPKEMSKKEFAKAVQGGQFSNLLTEDFKQKQLATAKAKQGLSEGVTLKGASPELSALSKVYTQTGGNWEQTANELANQGFDVSSGSVIDNELRRRNGLEPITKLTAPQQQAAIEADLQKQKGVDTANKALGILNQLETSGSLGAAVGPISSKLPTFRGGTSDFEKNFNSLKSLLTLENMGIMKGVLSDSDMKVIQAASTALDLGMSETGFKRELQNVRTILETRLGQVSQGQRPMSDEEAYAEYLKVKNKK